MNSEQDFYFFLRVGQLNHLEDLRQTGRLRMSCLSTFHEMKDEVGRGDRDDGLCQVLQPHLVKISAMGIDIPSSEIVGPIKVRHSSTRECHVFCMYGVTNRHLQRRMETGTRVLDPQMAGLGTHVLMITDGPEFIRRIEEAARRLDISLRADRVKYIDPESHHGNVDVFTKFSAYEYQSEWRIVVPPTGEPIYWFDLGQSLADISHICSVEEFEEGLQFSVDQRIEGAEAQDLPSSELISRSANQ